MRKEFYFVKMYSFCLTGLDDDVKLLTVAFSVFGEVLYDDVN